MLINKIYFISIEFVYINKTNYYWFWYSKTTCYRVWRKAFWKWKVGMEKNN